MILTVNRLIAVLQAVADEGHGNCHIEARNQAGDMEMVCLDNVFVESDQHGVFLLKIDPAATGRITTTRLPLVLFAYQMQFVMRLPRSG